ncbi:MAG: hypothetical protein AB7G93_21080 [Bdellovibrionales bacterium]
MNVFSAIFALTFFATQAAFSDPLDGPERAIALQNKIERSVMQIEGINGLGITGCDPETGVISDLEKEFVHCVIIYAETDGGAEQAVAKFPPGEKVDGVFVVVEWIGEIGPRLHNSGGH